MFVAALQCSHIHPGGPLYVGHARVDQGKHERMEPYQGTVGQLSGEVTPIDLGIQPWRSFPAYLSTPAFCLTQRFQEQLECAVAALITLFLDLPQQYFAIGTALGQACLQVVLKSSQQPTPGPPLLSQGWSNRCLRITWRWYAGQDPSVGQSASLLTLVWLAPEFQDTRPKSPSSFWPPMMSLPPQKTIFPLGMANFISPFLAILSLPLTRIGRSLSKKSLGTAPKAHKRGFEPMGEPKTLYNCNSLTS